MYSVCCPLFILHQYMLSSIGHNLNWLFNYCSLELLPKAVYSLQQLVPRKRLVRSVLWSVPTRLQSLITQETTVYIRHNQSFIFIFECIFSLLLNTNYCGHCCIYVVYWFIWGRSVSWEYDIVPMINEILDILKMRLKLLYTSDYSYHSMFFSLRYWQSQTNKQFTMTVMRSAYYSLVN